METTQNITQYDALSVALDAAKADARSWAEGWFAICRRHGQHTYYYHHGTKDDANDIETFCYRLRGGNFVLQSVWEGRVR